MKNHIWIIIFSAVIALCAAIWMVMQVTYPATKIIGIYHNGSLVEKIDLNTVTDEREIKLSDENGENVILISHGCVRMKSADCPDKICVNHGELTSSVSPIVCLPHRVIIKFENADDLIDVKTGA